MVLECVVGSRRVLEGAVPPRRCRRRAREHRAACLQRYQDRVAEEEGVNVQPLERATADQRTDRLPVPPPFVIVVTTTTTITTTTVGATFVAADAATGRGGGDPPVGRRHAADAAANAADGSGVGEGERTVDRPP